MPLFPWIREYISKYSFIKKTDFKGAIFHIYYEKDGKLLVKKLPYRADKSILMKTIDKIKKEVGFEEDRNRRIKEGQYDVSNQDVVFGFSAEDEK